jgi:hypothetical protein
MSGERVFSEQEVSQIIQRAVEIAEQQPAPGYTPGITLEELEKIAAEVGVEPKALAQAIREAGSSHRDRKGFQLVQEVERIVSGELDPSQFDLIAEGIKPLANAGQPAMAQIGRKLEMSAWAGTGQAKVSVVSRNGRTQIKVRSNVLFQALMTLHPAFVGSLVAVGVLAERGMGWIGAAIAAGLTAVGASLFLVLSKVGHQRAEALADDMRERVAQVVASATQVPSVTESLGSVEQRLEGHESSQEHV